MKQKKLPKGKKKTAICTNLKLKQTTMYINRLCRHGISPPPPHPQEAGGEGVNFIGSWGLGGP